MRGALYTLTHTPSWNKCILEKALPHEENEHRQIEVDIWRKYNFSGPSVSYFHLLHLQMGIRKLNGATTDSSHPDNTDRRLG
jgi:hypothetical protein